MNKTYSLFTNLFYTSLILLYLSIIFFLHINFINTEFLAKYDYIGIIALTFLTDGILLLSVVFRESYKKRKVSFNPKKLSILIACHNGEKVIAETIKKALVHVPKDQIIVVSDYSNDRTVSIAESFGVRVIENKVNMQKGLSISRGIGKVKTPYVLVLDDDTHIDKVTIPTSLLDEGYAAVSFNVTPIPENTLFNYMQRFEYRKSMILGKALKSSVGAVGNVSGAVGLFRTEDLKAQSGLHSGQYGGEDQQRTLYVHLKSSYKGIVFHNEPVFTKTPNTFKKWFKQRAYKWNSSTQELFWLSWKIVFSPKAHYLLKLNRAYYLFVFLTEPLRIILIVNYILTFSLIEYIPIYLSYLLLNTIAWIKVGRVDSFWVLLAFPFYSKFNMFCRQIAHFYWIYKKYEYISVKGWHKYVTKRKIVFEYITVIVIFVIIWDLTFNTYLNLFDTIFSLIQKYKN